MANPTGESNGKVVRIDFDRRLMLQFCGSVAASDAGCEFDNALGPTTMTGEIVADA